MITHEIAVTNEAIEPTVLDAGTKGSYGIYQMHFTFSDEWTGLIKKISFYPAGNAAPVVVVIDDDDLYTDIPQEATAKPGTCAFILSGSADGKALISLAGAINVADTKKPATTPAGSPTPTEIEQILNLIAGLNAVYVGPTEPTDDNILIWFKT